MKRTEKSDAFDFEKRLAELEGLVERMERGEITLEESLKDFERGVGLIRSCQKRLAEAEQRVETLTRAGPEPFDPGPRDDGA